jgi:hypothetical protein
MSNPERITSPYAPDLGEVREFLERMVKAMRFVELVRAVLAFVTRVCEVNGELTRKLAHLQRKRPRSEVLARVERQLSLKLAAPGVAPSEEATKPEPKPKKSVTRPRLRSGQA